MSTDLTPIVIQAADGTPTTTSLVIADGTDNQHASVIRLVRDNLADFKEFGAVGFEIRPLPGGGKPQQIAVLNEEQAALLMTYMRNSAIVREFKKRLVRAFFELRNAAAAAVPQTLPDALRAYAREVEAREALAAENRELAPKAEYVDQFVSPDDCLLFRTVASQICIGEKELRELLVERRWIYKQSIGSRFSQKAGRVVEEFEWRAYADKRDYFRLFSQHNAPRHHNNQLRQTLYITPPGEQAIARLVAKERAA